MQRHGKDDSCVCRQRKDSSFPSHPQQLQLSSSSVPPKSAELIGGKLTKNCQLEQVEPDEVHPAQSQQSRGSKRLSRLPVSTGTKVVQKTSYCVHCCFPPKMRGAIQIISQVQSTSRIIFYSPANLAPDEGNSCAKSVSRNGTISLTSLDAVLITSLALKTLIKERCWSSGVNSAVFRVVLRLCLTPERKRTALTPNHWTRKSTALCPPTLLTAQKSECEEIECN